MDEKQIAEERARREAHLARRRAEMPQLMELHRRMAEGEDALDVERELQRQKG